MNETIESMRLDKWLWTARFYKTRKLAADAVSGGKVHLNEQRSKPGKEVKPGSKLLIRKDQYAWDITVVGISKQRRPAKEAVLLYEETPESHAQRQKQVAENRENKTYYEHSLHDKRPNKKQRRQIHRFKQG